MAGSIVPAREGRAFKAKARQKIAIKTLKGAQAADFFAFNEHNIGEWLSANHTWVTTFNVKPREGNTLLSLFRRSMLRFVEDGAHGVHDMMIAACDQFRYEFIGHQGPTMRRQGFNIDVIPQPVNFFTCTEADEDATFRSPPTPVGPAYYTNGGYD